MRSVEFFGAFAACFLVSVATTGIIRRFAIRTGLLDRPTARSSHVMPTPRRGGSAIVFAFLAATAVLSLLGWLPREARWALLIGGGSVAVVGFIDDRRSLPASWRLATHLAAAALVVAMVGRIPSLSFSWSGEAHPWVGQVLFLLGISWATNLFNFIDGIDGIAASEAVFFGIAGAWINWIHGGEHAWTFLLLALGAASIGFMSWNWPPAKIFMGDVGSSFLGFHTAHFCVFRVQVRPAFNRAVDHSWRSILERFHRYVGP